MMLIVFDLDIPSLTESGIVLGEYDVSIPFKNVKELVSSSMNERRVNN